VPKTILHIHRQRIAQNIKLPAGSEQPPIIIRNGRKRQYANTVDIAGPCRIVYSPHKPLSCGARVWIETEAPVAGAL
jgi:hypothetical protein